jgi:hypothetical protein
MTDGTHLVWSHEHGAWWRPARWGYTTDPREAGHYPEAAAREICENANYQWLHGWVPPYGDLPAEVMVASPGLRAVDSLPFDELTALLKARIDEATSAAVAAREQQREATDA